MNNNIINEEARRALVAIFSKVLKEAELNEKLTSDYKQAIDDIGREINKATKLKNN